jgi:ribosomal protein S18 acetylase RimI-like enzyme
MKNAVLIRKATLKDLPRITQLWKSLMAYHDKHHGYGKGIFAYTKDKLALHLKFLKKQLRRRNAAVFVAEVGGKIVGHVMVQVNKVPPIYLHDKEAYICEIIVEDGYRGKGIGTALLEEVEAWANKKKMYSIGLTVHIANPEALSVYREFGFREHHLKMAKIVK